MDKENFSLCESFWFIANKLKNLVYDYMPRISSSNTIEDKNYVENINNESTDMEVQFNSNKKSSNNKNDQIRTINKRLSRYEMNTDCRGTFFIFSMDTQEHNTVQEIENYVEIAQLLGFKEILEIKSTSVDDIIKQISIYNETDHKNDACFALALVAHEKDKSLTEEGGVKQIFDELLTLNLPKNIPKIVFIEAFRGGNYETNKGSINNYILSCEMKDTIVAYSTINSEKIDPKEVCCSTFTKNVLDEIKNNGCSIEIHKLLTRVNKSVSKEKSSPNQFNQFSSFRSSLTKELYFN